MQCGSSQNVLPCEGDETWRMVMAEDPIAFHALNALNRSVMGWHLSYLSVQSSKTDLMSRLYELGPHFQRSLLLLALGAPFF